MIHVLLCRDHCNTKETVQLSPPNGGCILMDVSRVILSDRGTQFDSELWRELWTSLGTRVNMAINTSPTV